MSIKPLLVPLFPGSTDVTVSYPKLHKLYTLIKRDSYTFVFDGGKEHSAVLKFPSDVAFDDLLAHLAPYSRLVPVVPGHLAVEVSLVRFIYGIQKTDGTLHLRSEFKFFEDNGISQRIAFETDVDPESVTSTIVKLSPGSKFVKISDNVFYNINRKGLRRIATHLYRREADFWTEDLDFITHRFNEISNDPFVQFTNVSLRLSFLKTLHFIKKHNLGSELAFDPLQENLMPGESAPRNVILDDPPDIVYDKVNQAVLDELVETANAIPLPSDLSSEIVAMTQFAEDD